MGRRIEIYRKKLENTQEADFFLSLKILLEVEFLNVREKM